MFLVKMAMRPRFRAIIDPGKTRSVCTYVHTYARSSGVLVQCTTYNGHVAQHSEAPCRGYFSSRMYTTQRKSTCGGRALRCGLPFFGPRKMEHSAGRRDTCLRVERAPQGEVLFELGFHSPQFSRDTLGAHHSAQQSLTQTV